VKSVPLMNSSTGWPLRCFPHRIARAPGSRRRSNWPVRAHLPCIVARADHDGVIEQPCLLEASRRARWPCRAFARRRNTRDVAAISGVSGNSGHDDAAGPGRPGPRVVIPALECVPQRGCQRSDPEENGLPASRAPRTRRSSCIPCRRDFPTSRIPCTVPEPRVFLRNRAVPRLFQHFGEDPERRRNPPQRLPPRPVDAGPPVRMDARVWGADGER